MGFSFGLIWNTVRLMTRKMRYAYNTRLAQWGLTSFIETLCFYCKFVLADNLVFQNPPLRQAAKRYSQFLSTICVFYV